MIISSNNSLIEVINESFDKSVGRNLLFIICYSILEVRIKNEN